MKNEGGFWVLLNNESKRYEYDYRDCSDELKSVLSELGVNNELEGFGLSTSMLERFLTLNYTLVGFYNIPSGRKEEFKRYLRDRRCCIIDLKRGINYFMQNRV